MAKRAILLKNKETFEKSKLEAQLRGIQTSYQELKKKYDDLKNKFDQFEKIQKFMDDSSEKKNILQKEIITNIIKNFDKQPPGHSFSENMYQFSKIIHNTSSKSYEFLKDILILPCESCLSEYFSNDDKYYASCLENIELIPKLIQTNKEIYKIEDDLDCVMSIDAAGLDRPFKKSFPYVFVYYLNNY